MYGDAEVPVRLSTHYPRDHEVPLGWETVCWKETFSYKLVMVFKTLSYWCWVESHSVDISSVLYWWWSPGVSRTSHALYSQPRTFPLIHISTWWSSKAIYGHPRNSKLEVSSTSLLTTESWLDFLIFPLSVKLPGEWSFLRSLHFCFLSCIMASCMVTSPSWLFKGKRICDSWCLKGCPSVIFSVTRWVWRETGTDSESHTREEHLLSLAFPLPFSPEALVWGLDNLILGMPSSQTTCPSPRGQFFKL